MSAHPPLTATHTGTLHLVPTAQPKMAEGNSSAKPKKRSRTQDDPHAVFVILAACAVAFNASALLTGLLAAWVYYWRN